MKRVRIKRYVKPSNIFRSDDEIVIELSRSLGCSLEESLCLFVNASKGISQVVELEDVSDSNLLKLEHLGFSMNCVK